MFFWNSFVYDQTVVGILISGISAFSKSILYIWKFSVHILLKSSLKDFEHYLASIWNEHNCMVVLTFFDIALLCDWNENQSLPVLWPLLIFSKSADILSTALWQHTICQKKLLELVLLSVVQEHLGGCPGSAELMFMFSWIWCGSFTRDHIIKCHISCFLVLLTHLS